jgi:hypothetical protein
MHKNIVPTTLVGILRLAKDIKAEQRNIRLSKAQDAAARQAGFENLRHAQHVFSGKREAPVRSGQSTAYSSPSTGRTAIPAAWVARPCQ